MTDEMMNLKTLIEKTPDADLLREMIGSSACQPWRADQPGNRRRTRRPTPSATPLNGTRSELGERGEDPEHQFARRRRRVDRRALAGQHAKADTTVGEVVHDVDQMAKAAAEPVELPDDEGVTFAEGLEARLEARAVVALAAGGVAVEVSLRHAGGEERVALQVEDLRAVGFGDAHVADEGHRFSATPQTFVWVMTRWWERFRASFHITNLITKTTLPKGVTCG